VNGPAPTLLRIVSLRVLWFGLLAMSIQLVIVFASYWRDEEGLSRSLIELESERLAEGVVERDGGLDYVLKHDLAERYRRYREDGESEEDVSEIQDGYYARIRTRDGEVLFTNCGEECTDHFLPLTLDPPSFWVRVIRPGKPLFFAGGRTAELDGRELHIELAVIKDPEYRIARVLAEELVEHMLVPMTLMLTLVIGATIWSIRSALRPVTAAAAAADRIEPGSPSTRISTDRMPLEIARFATAVNRSIDRVGELIRAQKLFTSAIAHEIRTPAAIVRMELERIDHPGARKALGDLDSLTHILEQLTALARLEAVDAAAWSRVDLAKLGEDVVGAVAPYVFESGRTIAFADNGAVDVEAVPALVETLVRTLVENAVRHTPRGTSITVTAGPGPVVAVADDGPGFDGRKRDEIPDVGTVQAGGSLGIGLKIVEKIAALHGASVERTSAGEGGAVVTVRFPQPS
jgi:signal transduction histidine kinase